MWNGINWGALARHSVQEDPRRHYFSTRSQIFQSHEGDIYLQRDASETGLGASLMQNGLSVAYASRALTSTEQNYAQIEKELLAIVVGVEKFHQYTYERKVHMESDHKPLETIYTKPLVSAPKRLQRMLLRLQSYDLEIKYKPGRDMYQADTLYRAYLPKTRMARMPHPKSCKWSLSCQLQKKRYSTSKCQNTCRSLKPAWQKSRELRRRIPLCRPWVTQYQTWMATREEIFTRFATLLPSSDELSEQDGIIFKGNSCVIPTEARHPWTDPSIPIGTHGCLRRARENVYAMAWHDNANKSKSRQMWNMSNIRKIPTERNPLLTRSSS